MTLVGYFNSLRELGGMRRLVDDDIRNRLSNKEFPDRRGLSRRFLNLPFVEELTSRKSAGDIPRLLDWCLLNAIRRNAKDMVLPSARKRF